MHEPRTLQLAGSATLTSLASHTAGLGPTPDRYGHGRQRGRGQPVAEAGPCRWSGSSPPSPISRRSPPFGCRATRPRAGAVAARPRSLWLPRTTLAPWPDRHRAPYGIRCVVPPTSRRPPVSGPAVEPTTAGPPRPPTRRGRHCPLAHGHRGGDQKSAEAPAQTILFRDESDFYPLPSVVRTCAPVGQTPVLREWCTRDHLSAIGAISPTGKLSCHSQDHPINSDDVVGFLEPLLREVPGRMGLIWDGAPIHRSQAIQQLLARGAAPRLHLERLPASAPELNPGEGLWQQLKGVELRHGCGFNIPHLPREVREAVKRVRRRPRLITSFFRGAKL